MANSMGMVRVVLECLITYDSTLIVKVDEEQNFFGAGNFAYHLLVDPLLAHGVAILAHWFAQEVSDLVLGHSDLNSVDSC